MTLRNRRRLLQFAASIPVLIAASRTVQAQSYPSRPVRLVVGYPAGSGPDMQARLIGQWLTERLGQPFVIDNRPGAGSNIGTEVVVRAAPDGYTLLLVAAANASNTTLYRNLNFNFVRDIAPVASIARVPLTMEVHPSVPAKTIGDFVAYAKANPGKINMASSGSGALPHVAGELFKAMTGTDLVHVPYRGGVAALTDLVAGRVQVRFGVIIESIEHIRSGKLRALGVTTTARSQALPDTPSIGEFVPGYEASAWAGVGAPKHTNAAIIEKLNQEINAALVDGKVKARLTELGAAAFVGSPADFGTFIAHETDKWGKVIRIANIKPD
jgi:tripartite-type tricarboxylate transporter receptor subunit TctC